ncbi:hypothetical protein BGZ83_001445 [Gryganskiella cystojenkinii]|nr:hypothetical protein BGZ83_001445 [Gryganskiella cystojenkinii]
MERISSSGSIKRPSSINSGSGTMPTSPVHVAAPLTAALHDDAFSNNPEDYDIRLPIGYGSSAVVYNAYYKPLNKRVAIKVIDLDMFERNQIDELRRETQVMALCKHPNVLRVNGAFVMDSKLYIVTPFLSAGSCLDIMKTAYPDGFDEVSIATILKQALQGLDYLHKNGHIHRDVKAGNLLMDDDGSVLLADFGVSSSLMENGDRRGMRKTFVGTPCWMAPEVMEQAGYDYKADIWSFGITAIELATGHAPFAKYPPIKVLMLTLSNDPPTLDRESTKHRYSKMLKEMIDSCLQKDPARRPSAEKLLGHPFFKQAKKKSHLVTALLHNLPPLEQRPQKKSSQKMVMPEKGVSWDFDADDTPLPQPPTSESTRRPRTVTFEPTERPLSTATTDSASSATDHAYADSHQGLPTPALPSVSLEKPIKKSRFVVEDPASPSIASPPSSYSVDMSPSPSGAISPALSVNGTSVATVQTSQGLQGLGVTANVPVPETITPEVKKGRFSVKDTTLSITSPSPSSLKSMANDSLLSPNRSLSSSPVEGADGAHIGLPLDLGSAGELYESWILENRKSRFEVHHSNGQSPATPAPSANGTGLSSPVLSGTRILAQDTSQSRTPTGEAGLSRDSSATRVSRFNVESTIQAPHENHSNTGATPAAGTPNASQSKRSRFQVSSVDGRPTDIAIVDLSSSTNTTPNTSPSASLLRGQVAVIEAQNVPGMYAHLDTLYRQNEQQRVILAELFAGLGLKAGGGSTTTTAVITPSSSTKSVHLETSHVNAGTIASTLVANAKTDPAQGHMDKQHQSLLRENENLRKDNDALKRELERVRRGGCTNKQKQNKQTVAQSDISCNKTGLSQWSNDRLGRIRAIGKLLVGPVLDPEQQQHRGEEQQQQQQQQESPYDIVGLQEVWHHSDFLILQEIVQDVLPFSKHWTSGLFGSGLAVFSKFPIQSVALNRFKLNGDPYWFLHGDWFDGKSCASCVIEHPVVGEIEVFNTHFHAAYDPVGTLDRYLGCRVSQAWEVARMLRTSKAVGRHVLAMGDFNSSPTSVAVKVLRHYGGVTDSWDQLHPVPMADLALLPIPAGLTPEQGQALLGLTCDTPLNSWMPHKDAWVNELTGDRIGERLDYIFYNETPKTFVCQRIDVVFKEGVQGIGRNPETELKNVSDHFGVHAQFLIKPMGSRPIHSPTHASSSSNGGNNNNNKVRNGQDKRGNNDIAHNTYAAAAAAVSALAKRALPKSSASAVQSQSATEPHRYHSQDAESAEDEEMCALFEEVEVVLAQHLVRAQNRVQKIMLFAVPLMVTLALALLLGPALWVAEDEENGGGSWKNKNEVLYRWILVGLSMGASLLTLGWVMLFMYGFFYGGETISAFVNVIQEVQVSTEYHRRRLALKQGHPKDHVRLSMPRTMATAVQGKGHKGPIRLN